MADIVLSLPYCHCHMHSYLRSGVSINDFRPYAFCLWDLHFIICNDNYICILLNYNLIWHMCDII